ncbi:hypothetical protein SAMN05444365_10792 [Micromonospora pattaloongensis]|uniref:Uncharacterized protein n=2 Tax=Micromonospora pattaloongensis TaxID=405436 RepID=A0A1H3R6G9_9ACTN|nr:hypothetical protein SAMN05444365_10792 [Micromonospora pattaloongensis]
MNVWPEGAHLTVGLWFDRPSAPCALAQVCDVLESQGAGFNGAVASGPREARFSWVFEVHNFGFTEGLPPSLVRNQLHDGALYRVGMHMPGLGPVAVTYDGTPRAELPAAAHPVLLVLEADEFGMPREVWSADDHMRAEQRQQRVMQCLKTLCDMLDPAYAVLGVEHLTPIPAALTGGASLAADAYVSRRLSGAAAPMLPVRLAEVAAYGREVPWRNGVFYSGGSSPQPTTGTASTPHGRPRPCWSGRHCRTNEGVAGRK